jgi:glycosyltransferase involved in cell wall biosynthesis
MLRDRKLRVVIATPFGAQQRGGIDRLVDLIVGAIESKPDGDILVSRLVTRGTGKLVWAPFVFARALVQFYIAARRGDVDLLHINLAAGGSAYRKAFLARLAQHLGVPYVVHLHGSRFDKFWPSLGAISRRMLVPFFNDSGGVIVLGQYWAQFVADHIPTARQKIIILPNATAPAKSAREAAKDGRVQVSFLGELGPRKGTPQLLDALGQLAGRRDWHATIAGNGQLQQMRLQAQKLGISDRVDIPGLLNASEVDAVLRRTDIFVLPSFAENLPMSILEAFAYGIPVIATPVGAVTEVVTHERNGLVVPTGDVSALGSALRRLIEDEELRRTMGAAAQRDHAGRYEIGGYVSRLMAIWRRVVRGQPAQVSPSTKDVPFGTVSLSAPDIPEKRDFGPASAPEEPPSDAARTACLLSLNRAKKNPSVAHDRPD